MLLIVTRCLLEFDEITHRYVRLLKIRKRLFRFSPPEVSVVSNPSLRYQKAAEESSAEKKKVSISLHLKAVFINQSEKTLKPSRILTPVALISFSLATS